jgi:hypothetical protein
MKLTDRKITEIYLGIKNHYLAIRHGGDKANEIMAAINYRLYEANGDLYNLTPDDKEKIISILVVTFNSLESKRSFNNNSITRQRFIDYPRDANYSYGCREHYTFSTNYSPVFLYINICPTPSSHHYTSNSVAEVLALIVIILLLIFAVCASLEYIISNSIDCFDRITHNEGAIQASFALTIMGASTIAGTLLAFYLLSAPIACLALSVGITNPLGLVIFISICFGLIGGAITQVINNYATKTYYINTHNDALISEDPYKFTLTSIEEENLIKKGIDPIKVKCALIELKISLEDAPSRRSIYSSQQNYTIQKVHELRRGELDQSKEVVIDRMTFNLAKIEPAEAIRFVSISTEP